MENNVRSEAQQYTYAPIEEKKSRMPGWVKAIIIILCIVLGFGLLTVGCGAVMNGAAQNLLGGYDILSILQSEFDSSSVSIEHNGPYIGVLYIDGEISEDGVGTYNHEYILKAIDEMAKDSDNKGILLWEDTPGGSAFASDEVYLKLIDYKKKTGRPIYASMQSMSASGGYYIACAADKIIANRNCWTGSIGVTIGAVYDITGLLDKLGVKATTIASSENKSMGSMTSTLTEEQIAIFQGLVDEAYDQFVSIVCDSRKMDKEKVVKLADGRVYTAKQAVENGLIDEIGSYDDAKAEMEKLTNCSSFVELKTASAVSLTSLFSKASENNNAASEVEDVLKLTNSFKISYYSSLTK